jgi:F0F1-type ATP synthase membrane subunit c/vacuolar-type H+-ATPase subunit K
MDNKAEDLEVVLKEAVDLVSKQSNLFVLFFFSSVMRIFSLFWAFLLLGFSF